MSNQVDLTLKIGSDLVGLKQAKTELDRFFAGLKAGFNLNLGAKLADVITGIPAAALNSLREYSALTENIVRETERSRGALGLSATAYQTYANTLASANQDASALGPALSTLSRTIGEAATGSTVAAAKLGAIGLTFEQLRGLAPEQQLEPVARRIEGLSDANVRDAAAADLLGRSYASLKPLLEALARDGFEGLAKKVEATTGLIKDEHSKAIDEAATRSENAGKRIAAALAPALATWKNMVASAKEYAANLIAGAPAAQAPLTSAQIGADVAREQAKGKTVEEIEALRSRELQAIDVLFADDPYLDVIKARVDAFEAAIVEARGEQAATNALVVTQTAEADKKALTSFETNFRQRLALEQAIAQSRREQSGKQIQQDIEDQRAARRQQFTADQAKLARDLAVTETAISQIEADRFKTTLQKETEIQPLLKAENKLIADRIELLSKELATNSTLTPAERQQLQDKIDQLEKELARIQGKQTTTAPLNFSGQMSADLTKLRDSWGTTSQQISGFITNGIGTAIDGVSDGIYGLITKTKTWGQVGLQVGAQILQSLIKTGVQIVANSALGLTAQKTQQATAATTGPSIAASYAPASAAVNTATYGSSAVIGAAAAAVAIGLIIGLLAAHKEGGPISGPGTGTSDSIIARLSDGEFVMRSAAVNAIGIDRMAYINRTGRLPGFAEGGSVSIPALSRLGSPAASAEQASLPPMYFHADARSAQRQAWANGDYDAVFVDVFRRVQHRLG